MQTVFARGGKVTEPLDLEVERLRDRRRRWRRPVRSRRRRRGRAPRLDPVRDAPDDLVISQALLAYSTDGFLIGTAMRPHEGVSQAQAHLATPAWSATPSPSTSRSRQPVDAPAQESSYAGRGRSYGRAHVFTEDGTLIASFVQDAMIRSFRTPAASGRYFEPKAPSSASARRRTPSGGGHRAGVRVGLPGHPGRAGRRRHRSRPRWTGWPRSPTSAAAPGPWPATSASAELRFAATTAMPGGGGALRGHARGRPGRGVGSGRGRGGLPIPVSGPVRPHRPDRRRAAATASPTVAETALETDALSGLHRPLRHPRAVGHVRPAHAPPHGGVRNDERAAGPRGRHPAGPRRTQPPGGHGLLAR